MEVVTLILAVALVLLGAGSILVGVRLKSLRDPEADEERLREEIARAVTEASSATRAEVDERLEELGGRVEEVARLVKSLLEREPGTSVAEELAPVLREAVDALDARINELSSAVVTRRVETVYQTVTRVLGEKGFSDVTILEEPTTDGERTRVLVNARRDGMTYKGSVHLEGASVVEQSLAPSYPMFP
ncbi:MAG: hypothetical protein ACYTDY_08575 [Planctomycetota bacterium]|jgi:hypothetical protein